MARISQYFDWELSVVHSVEKNFDTSPHVSHVHHLYELLFCIKSDASCVVEDKIYPLGQYDLMFIRPTKYHHMSFNSTDYYERICIHFPRRLILFDVDKIAAENELFHLADDDIVKSIFNKFDFYIGNFSQEQLKTVIPAMINEILCNLCISQRRLTAPAKLSPLVSNAIEYVADNLFTIKNVNEISEKLFVSEGYFFRAFKNEMSVSPKKYVLEKRLIYAQKEISKGRKATQVAAECGFDSYSGFYRSYLKFFNCLPSEKEIPLAENKE